MEEALSFVGTPSAKKGQPPVQSTTAMIPKVLAEYRSSGQADKDIKESMAKAGLQA